MFNGLLNMYLAEFQNKGEVVLKTICNCTVPSNVVLSHYKKLVPIEDLPEKDKNELWLYAKEIYPDGDKETRIRFTKIVYTIGNLI